MPKWLGFKSGFKRAFKRWHVLWYAMRLKRALSVVYGDAWRSFEAGLAT